jgi:hypothetical protein
MVEQNSITSEDAISLSVVDGDPVSIELGSTIRGPWVKRSCLLLRNLLYLPVKLTS